MKFVVKIFFLESLEKNRCIIIAGEESLHHYRWRRIVASLSLEKNRCIIIAGEESLHHYRWRRIVASLSLEKNHRIIIAGEESLHHYRWRRIIASIAERKSRPTSHAPTTTLAPKRQHSSIEGTNSSTATGGDTAESSHHYH